MKDEQQNITEETNQTGNESLSAVDLRVINFLPTKAHQRIIREEKGRENFLPSSFFDRLPKQVDIKDAVCREISFKQAEQIILEYEWLGTMGITQYHYGIFFDNVLAGAICFGYFQSPNGYANYVGEKYNRTGIQLTRGACVHWAHEHSGSKLIAYGLKQMQKRKYKYVVAFSDWDAGEIGTLYQATNWYYVGKTKLIHYDLYRRDGKKFLDARDIYKKLGIDSKSKRRITEYATANDLIAKPLTPKGRYIYLLAKGREREEMFNILKTKTQPYPKRQKYL